MTQGRNILSLQPNTTVSNTFFKSSPRFGSIPIFRYRYEITDPLGLLLTHFNDADGFALWDTKETSNRSALHYGPRRDVLRELFDAAATYHPNMKRGTYFSLPEWFNPDYGVYGFDQFNKTENPGTVSWPGNLATNPYTGEKEEYTGHIPVGDFIQDLMVPQMEQLVYDYGTDIMWCDCGAANGTADFAAKWFNEVRQQNRHVAINSRCGVPQAADFDTPEYQTFSSAQHHKWESSQGMDPYSYGYNRATPDEAYMNASIIIRHLVDMVSKNGNFLLDIGPRADGTIVEQAANNLREAGKWIKRHQEAIFNTTYWFIQSELEGSTEARFTQTDDAFYILFLDKPIVQGGFVVIQAPIPVLIGDDVTLLGGDDAVSLDYDILGDGSEKSLRIEIGEKELEREEFCWVFKIQYKR
jgi:alpha-L-fucosidase